MLWLPLCRNILLICIIVGQRSTVLAIGAGMVCMIFFLSYPISFLSSSLSLSLSERRLYVD